MRFKAEIRQEELGSPELELGKVVKLRTESINVPLLKVEELKTAKLKIRPLGGDETYQDTNPNDILMSVKLDGKAGESYEGKVLVVEDFQQASGTTESVYDVEVDMKPGLSQATVTEPASAEPDAEPDFTMIVVPSPDGGAPTYFVECRDFDYAWLKMRKVLPINQNHEYWYTNGVEKPRRILFNEAPVTPSDEVVDQMRDVGGEVFPGGSGPVEVKPPQTRDTESVNEARESARLSWLTTQILFQSIINQMIEGALAFERREGPADYRFAAEEYYVKQYWREDIESKLDETFGSHNEEQVEYAAFVIAHEVRRHFLDREYDRALENDPETVDPRHNIFPPNVGVYLPIFKARSGGRGEIMGDLVWFTKQTKSREAAFSQELAVAYQSKLNELIERYKALVDPFVQIHKKAFEMYRDEFLAKQKELEAKATAEKRYEIRAAGELILAEQAERLSNRMLSDIFQITVEGDRTFYDVLVNEYDAEKKAIIRPDLDEIGAPMQALAPKLASMLQLADAVIRDSNHREMEERLLNMHAEWDKIEAYLISTLGDTQKTRAQIQAAKDEFFYLYSSDFLFEEDGSLSIYAYKMFALSQADTAGSLFYAFNDRRATGSPYTDEANLQLASEAWTTLNMLARILNTPESEKGTWEDFKRGMNSKITWEMIPFGRSIGSALESETLNESSEIYFKGGELTPVQEGLIDSFGVFNQSAAQSNPSSAYNVGKMTAETIAPIMEYIITSGPAMVFGGGAGSIVAGSMSRLGMPILTRVVSGLANVLVASTIQTLSDPMEIYANMKRYERPITQMMYNSKTGELSSLPVRQGETAGRALYNGFVDAWTEMFTERLGGRLTAGGTKLATSLLARGAKRTAFLNGLSMAGKLFAAAGYHGPIGEYEEELWQQVLSSWLKGEHLKLDFTQQMEIFATCAIVGAPMISAQTVFASYQMVRTFHNNETGTTIVLPEGMYAEMIALNSATQVDAFIESLGNRNLSTEQLELATRLAKVLKKLFGAMADLNMEAVENMSETEATESLEVQLQIMKALLATREQMAKQENADPDAEPVVHALSLEIEGEMFQLMNFSTLEEVDFQLEATMKAVALLMDRVHGTELAAQADLSADLITANLDIVEMRNQVPEEQQALFEALVNSTDARTFTNWMREIRQESSTNEALAALAKRKAADMTIDSYAADLLQENTTELAEQVALINGKKISTEIDGNTVTIQNIVIEGEVDNVAAGTLTEESAKNLVTILAGFTDPDVTVRRKSIKDLRKGVEVPLEERRNDETSGAVPVPLLEAHVAAVQQLNKMIIEYLTNNNVDAIVAFDRGGTHLLSQIEGIDQGSGKVILVKKPKENHHEVQRDELVSIMEGIARGKPNGRVLLVETFISGGSVKGTVDHEALVKFFKKNKDFKLDIAVLHQDTQEKVEKRQSAEQILRTSGKPNRKLKRRNQMLNDGQLSIMEVELPYILAEDVDHQTDRLSGDQKPIIVYRVKGDQIEAVVITPIGEATSQSVMSAIGKGKAKGKLGNIY